MKKKILMLIVTILTAIALVNYLPIEHNWNQNNIEKIIPSEDYCFSVVGDTHSNFPVFNMFLKTYNRSNSFVVVNGDFIHMGTNEEYNFATMMFRQIKVPTLITIGNHEVMSSNDGMFERMFGKTYYSFYVSDDHFIVLDNSETTLDMEQYEWLKQELDKESRHTFIIMHIPIFDPWEGDYYTDDASILANLFNEKNVTLVISSHMHKYQEFFYEDTRYVITGSGGGYTEMMFENITLNGENFSYVDVCVNRSDVTLSKIEFGQQNRGNQELYVSLLLMIVIFYKAVLLAIVLHLAISFLKKNIKKKQ